MTTLLLRLAGAMQSWGVQSRFTMRETGLEPSKSGVVGLLCAALGRPRWEPVDDLAGCRMGVRVEREGALRLDYHTAGGTHRRGEGYGVAAASGKRGGTVVSRRYYLADADFLVGLESEDTGLLHCLDQALAAPHWQLYLGRKAFVPGVPVRLPDQPPRGPGLRDGSLGDVLRSYPWFGDPARGRQAPGPLRLLLETDAASGEEVRMDQPAGAAFRDRRFVIRHVTTTLLALGVDVPIAEV